MWVRQGGDVSKADDNKSVAYIANSIEQTDQGSYRLHDSPLKRQLQLQQTTNFVTSFQIFEKK